MKPIVIIGTGLAGYTLAREFRRLDAVTPLLMITADDGSFYSKPMLSNALAKGKTAETLVTASAEQMAAELGLTTWNHTEVSTIDVEAHRLVAGGRPVEYASLVLAVGAEPVRLAFGGDAADEVMSINNLSDYARFREAAGDAAHIAIIGAGLIGCEFANDLAHVGKQVVVIGPDTCPLARLLPPPAGLRLQEALSAIGVQWRLGVVAEKLMRAGERYRLVLSDGDALEADVVISAVGLRPNTALARQAGLAAGRGIIVDRHLETSAGDVYALGDCAEVAGLVLPFVMPLMHAARALARTLAGSLTAVCYPAMPVVVKTPACPVVIAPPAADTVGEWHIESNGDSVQALFRDLSGRLRGFALTGAATANKQALTKELPAVRA